MDSNQLRTGHKILMDGIPYEVLNYALRQQPRLATKINVELRNMLSGAKSEKTFTSGENCTLTETETRQAQFLYSTGDEYSFMDNESFEQFEFNEKILGKKTRFLMEDMKVNIVYWNGQALDVILPATVTLTVTETPPGVRGDTATGGLKPATLETGLVVKVPLFINEGEKLVINTESGEYKERAK